MPLKVSDGIGAWIKDFQKSDAPQFKNRSKEERRDQAIAAYLSAKGESVEENVSAPRTPAHRRAMMGIRHSDLEKQKDVEKVLGKGAKPIPKNAKNSDGTKTKPMSRASQLARQARDAQPVDEKVEYAEYQFKNRKHAEKAHEYLKSVQRQGLNVEDDSIHRGQLRVDADDKEKNKDISQHHNHIMKNFPGVKATHVESYKVKLKGFGPDNAKGNMNNPSARAALNPMRSRSKDNEKARQALKDPNHNPAWANSKTPKSNFAGEARDPSKSGGSGYDLYHKDFSSAMKHAYGHAKNKLGVDIDPKEIDDKVASGPRKPSKGKTNRYRLMGKDGKKAVQIQVHGMDSGKYELNMYKESVELDEATDVSRPLATTRKYSGSEHEGSTSPVRLSGRERAKHLAHEEEFAKRADYHRNEANKDGLSVGEYQAHRKAEKANHLAYKLHFRVRRESDNGKPATAGTLHRAHHAANKAIQASKRKWSLFTDQNDLGESVSVELDEAVLAGKHYKVKDGKVHISRANFSKVHKDYKNATKGKERMTVLDPKSQATVSAPVVFEAKDMYKSAAQELKTYADKSGGMDKKDFHAAAKNIESIGRANVLQKGQLLAKFSKQLRDLDTSPREKILSVLDKHGHQVGDFMPGVTMKKSFRREGVQEGSLERLKMIRKAGEKYNKEKKAAARKAERDAKRGIKQDPDLVEPQQEGAGDEGAKAARSGKSYSSNPYPKGSSDHLAWSKAHNQARARQLNMGEEFTMKHYRKNEDENRHSENALELAKKFGTEKEKITVKRIYDRHMKRGHITEPDRSTRDRIARKHYPKLTK